MRMKEFLSESELDHMEEAAPFGLGARAVNWAARKLQPQSSGGYQQAVGQQRSIQIANSMYGKIRSWMGTANKKTVSVNELFSIPGGEKISPSLDGTKPQAVAAKNAALAQLKLKPNLQMDDRMLANFVRTFTQTLAATPVTQPPTQQKKDFNKIVKDIGQLSNTELATLASRIQATQASRSNRRSP